MNLDSLTWTCHVCGDVRPDAKISVFTHEREVNGVSFRENVRHCNDRPPCVEGAKSFHFLP